MIYEGGLTKIVFPGGFVGSGDTALNVLPLLKWLGSAEGENSALGERVRLLESRSWPDSSSSSQCLDSPHIPPSIANRSSCKHTQTQKINIYYTAVNQIRNRGSDLGV